MDIKRIFRLVTEEFSKNGIQHAVIGGQALAAFDVHRMTMDIDLMILLPDRNAADMALRKLGYTPLLLNENVGNYVSDEPEKGRIDLLFAHRKYSLSMMNRASEKNLFGLRIKVLAPEDIIGLKVQSSSNDPQRMDQDRADIFAILLANRKRLDMGIIREYFSLFGRLQELERILEEIDESH